MSAGFGFIGEQYGYAIWSNFPVSDVPRPGLTLGSLSTTQRDAALHMLQVLLSPTGYQKVLEIMGADQALSEQGNPFAAGIATFTVGVFGHPSVATPWMLQYGGHHLALNITIAKEHGEAGFAQGRRQNALSATQARLIGIGAAVAHRPLPHHRAYGSVHGGSSGYANAPRSTMEVQATESRH